MLIAQRQRHVLEGVGVSPGYAIGPAHLIAPQKLIIRKYHLLPEEVTTELDRFEEALRASEAQLAALKAHLQDARDEHYLILDAHQLMLRDVMLVDGVRQNIAEEGINAEWALKKVTRSIKRIFDNIDDEYFRERRSDVEFVSNRLLRNLCGYDQPGVGLLAEPSVVIAHDLSPAETASLVRGRVKGFAIDMGGKTSHTAIVARSLELPAVVALEQISEIVRAGDELIIDGRRGRVIVNPTPAERARYRAAQVLYEERLARLEEDQGEAATTLDGVEIRILANIERPQEALLAMEHGAEGVGLFRTEYLYMNRETLPSEEEQYEGYRMVLESAGERGATIRTLDLGGDKLSGQLKLDPGANPVMGLRAIRLCLHERELFKVQLRALLRASVHGSLRLLIPLISGMEEIEAVEALLDEVRADLWAEGVPFADDIPFGVMIELPAAAIMAPRIAERVDFFSIGTNDLVQYTLAVDRANEQIAHLYQPLHPAILWMIEHTIAAAKAAKIPVTLCGEMAGEPFYAPILLALGLESFSMNAASVPLVKSALRSLSVAQSRAWYDTQRHLDRSAHLEDALYEILSSWFSEELRQSLFDGSICL